MRERNEEIAKLRTEGWTLKRLGEKYGVSKERIRQILAQEEKRRMKP